MSVQYLQFLFITSLLYFRIAIVFGTSKCVWVRGALQCHRDASKHGNVEVRVIDRDGWGPFKLIDPDDLMGITLTEPDGTFQLDGCGSDPNIMPGAQNLPDPFVRILHFCNSEKGETLELPEFRTFVPDTYDLGILVLDDVKHPNATVSFTEPEKPRRQGQRPSTVGTTSDEEEHLISEDLSTISVDEPKLREDKSIGSKADEDKFVLPISYQREVDNPLPSGKTVKNIKPDDQLFWEAQSVELLDTSSTGSSSSASESAAKELGGRRKNWTKKEQFKEKEATRN